MIHQLTYKVLYNDNVPGLCCFDKGDASPNFPHIWFGKKMVVMIILIIVILIGLIRSYPFLILYLIKNCIHMCIALKIKYHPQAPL